MIHNRSKKAFTLVELIVSIAIAALVGGYAWKVYFSGSETMRHTVSQSQIQSDIRNFLDDMETEMMSCYAFDTVDSENKKFSYFSYTYGKVSLDDIYYDVSGEPRETNADSDARIKVKKIEYSWADGKVTKKRTPGWLYFLHKPWTFEEEKSASAIDTGDQAMEKEILKDISEFEIKGYSQLPDLTSDTGIKVTPVTPETATETTFIVLRLHALKDEVGKRRDEEIDIVTKFYSAIRLAEAANPGYFSSTDSDGRY